MSCTLSEILLRLPAIERFLKERFIKLSTTACENNCQTADDLNCPSWAASHFFSRPNGQTFGSNVVITRDEFANVAHKDRDATGHSIGLFGLAHRDTGHLYRDFGANLPSWRVDDAYFRFKDYKFQIHLGQKNRVVEMLWATDELHRSTISHTYNPFGLPVSPRYSPITLFGSSIQVSRSIVSQLRRIKVLCGNRNGEEFQVEAKKHIQDYQEVMAKKIQMIMAKKYGRIYDLDEIFPA